MLNGINENILAWPGIRLGGLVGRMPACRAGYPGSNSGSGETLYCIEGVVIAATFSRSIMLPRI